jgi:hypothetical protein
MATNSVFTLDIGWCLNGHVVTGCPNRSVSKATEEQFGKQIVGLGEQPFQNQAVVYGCTGMGYAVGSVALWVDVGVRQKMIFLLDTGLGSYVNRAA